MANVGSAREIDQARITSRCSCAHADNSVTREGYERSVILSGFVFVALKYCVDVICGI